MSVASPYARRRLAAAPYLSRVLKHLDALVRVVEPMAMEPDDALEIGWKDAQKMLDQLERMRQRIEADL